MLKKIIQSCVIFSALLSAHSSFAACDANIDMGNKKITNLSTPTNAKDATNKKYVDMGNWRFAHGVSSIGGTTKSSYNHENGIFCFKTSLVNFTGSNILHNRLLATFSNLPVTLEHPIYVPAFENGAAAELYIYPDGRLVWHKSVNNTVFDRSSNLSLFAEGCYKL